MDSNTYRSSTEGSGTGTSEKPITEPTTPASGTEHTTLMGILSYLGILVIIPFLMAKENPFVKFHIKQGLVLVAIQLLVWLLSETFLFKIDSLVPFVQIVLFILSVIGIVNVLKKRERELPFVGSFAKYIKF